MILPFVVVLAQIATPLHRAACALDGTTVQSLLEQGANPNATDEKGRTPLMCVASNLSSRLPDAMDVLLQHGANVNAQDRDGMTALMLAVKPGNIWRVRKLLEHGASVSLRAKDGRNAIDLARDQSLGDILMLLQPEPSSDPKDLDARLLAVAELGDVKAIEELIRRGANPNAAANGFSALTHAAHAGKLDAVKALVAHQASFAAEMPQKSAVAQAATAKQWLVFDYLLDRRQYDETQLTAALLYLAGDAPRTKRVLALGGDARGIEGYFVTPLINASAAGCLPCVDALLAAGADPSKSASGATAIGEAERGRHRDIVQRLERAMNVDHRNDKAVLLAVRRAIAVDEKKTTVRMAIEWLASDRALVRVTTYCGPTCGSGKSYVVTRSGDAWGVVEVQPAWVN